MATARACTGSDCAQRLPTETRRVPSIRLKCCFDPHLAGAPSLFEGLSLLPPALECARSPPPRPPCARALPLRRARARRRRPSHPPSGRPSLWRRLSRARPKRRDTVPCLGSHERGRLRATRYGHPKRLGRRPEEDQKDLRIIFKGNLAFSVCFRRIKRE